MKVGDLVKKKLTQVSLSNYKYSVKKQEDCGLGIIVEVFDKDRATVMWNNKGLIDEHVENLIKVSTCK